MFSQRLATILTAFNLVLLAFLLAQGRPAVATSSPSVLRGRALELVDERGRVRAEIKVMPAEPALKMPDGTVGYPETVLLRLIDSQGGPNVKIAATEDGSGLVLGGESAYVQVLSRGQTPFLKIVNKDGRQRTIDAAQGDAQALKK
jgi:hypothetical protein